jgi:hypothetical protein
VCALAYYTQTSNAATDGDIICIIQLHFIHLADENKREFSLSVCAYAYCWGLQYYVFGSLSACVQEIQSRNNGRDRLH